MKIILKYIIFIYLTIASINVLSNEAPDTFDPFAQVSANPLVTQLLNIAQKARNDLSTAQQQYKSLDTSEIEQLELPLQIAHLLAKIAIKQASNDYLSANALIKTLKLFANRHDEQWILSIYYERLALNNMRQGKYLQAAQYSTQAIDLAASINYLFIEASARITRGVSYSKLSKSGEALQDYIKAHNFFQQVGNLDKVVTIYTNQVTLYLDRFEYAQALIMSDNAISTLSLMPQAPTSLVAANYINRAIALAYLGKKDEELTAYLKAQEYALQANDLEIQASVYANISDYFLRYQNYQLAIERAKRCIEIAEQINQLNLVAICLLNQGLATIHLNDIQHGIDMIERAHQLTKQEGMKSTLLDVYTAYTEAYTTINDHETANKWLTKRYEAVLIKAKHDREHDFSEQEKNFKAIIQERENLHQSLKSTMTNKLLSQQSVMHGLWFSLILISLLLLGAVWMIIRIKRSA
ncbi:tetratricopeptide repeat protein [Thalassotalea hakodatensis]|uniref:tetratricopeptide repeat protein n=1 Tax=Thalassotalea hakodatensis TaxID=3030492 RepID=UPI002573D550|nr:tetratricopeptide repeat protein [Thalassotalea hakodatensis]